MIKLHSNREQTLDNYLVIFVRALSGVCTNAQGQLAIQLLLQSLSVSFIADYILNAVSQFRSQQWKMVHIFRNFLVFKFFRWRRKELNQTDVQDFR